MDNSTIIQIAPYTNTPTKDTMKLSHEGLDLLSGAAQAMGEQVYETKNKWYLLDFKWYRAVKWRLADNEPELFLQNTVVPQNIEQIYPFEASRIIGVWIGPNVSWT